MSRRDDAALTLSPRGVGAVKSGVTTARSVAWRFARGRRPGGPGVRILYYHRVSDDPDALAIAPTRFSAQMEHLAAGGYKVVGVMAAAEAAATGDDPRLVGLSFDDGYRDVAENALPILEQHGFEATVFVATAVVGGSARFDWYDEQPAVLSWPEITELDRGGTLRFEAHTRTHPNLLALSEDAARREIAGSKADLEERLERPVDVFCYPAGLYRREHRELVADAGFRAAATCDRGANQPGGDPLLLRRIAIDGTDRMIDFDAKLNGAHDTPLPLQQLYRRFRYGVV